MTATAQRPLRRVPSPAGRVARWLALPAVAAVFLLGVWFAGGVVTDSFRASMALVAAWYVVAAAAVLAVARARRRLALPMVAGYAIAAVGVGAYLGLTTLRDRVVDERVAVGVPAAQAGERRAPERAVPVEELNGRFVSGEHATEGRAAIVRLPSGRRVLTLTRFDTSAGPDLRVRLVPGRTGDGGADGNVDLGALKGNRGDQQYDLPAGLDPRNHTVVIWCRAFSATFGSAVLAAA